MDGDRPSEFGSLLRQLRLDSGLTQERLAEASGLSTRGIQELERGCHRPYRDTVLRLTQGLGLHGDDLRRLHDASRRRPHQTTAKATAQATDDEPPSDESGIRAPDTGASQPDWMLRERRWSAHNLPAELTSFVGRRREIAEVEQLIGRSRLVTLTGVGGCGKTRLALRVAAELVGDYAEGPWLVELGPLSDPRLVVGAIACALSVSETPGEPLLDTVAREVGARRLLVVIDNCEHVVDECARAVESLLRSCPSVRVLATSREYLQVAGEVAFRVLPLSAPEPGETPPLERLTDYESVQLFVERVRAVHPSFALDRSNASAVTDICSRLDGIPLALELAAARTECLSVERLASRLDRPFHLLAHGPRTAPVRQQALSASVDWSYCLLGEKERALLRQLTLLGSRFSLEAVEARCSGAGIRADEALDLLACLVRKSLVLAEEASGETCYRLFHTIRQYAREKLVEPEGQPAEQEIPRLEVAAVC